METLEKNCADFGMPYFSMDDIRQGIVHIIGPEQGMTQPGMIIVCGDSHTATHGAFGALAFGIGTSEVEHVLATQTLIQQPAKNMRITVEGDLPFGVTAKDLILAIIGKIGTAGGTGHVIEYAGKAIRDLSMEGRMTVCNMSIEARRPRRADRPGRDDLRLSQGPPHGAQGRRLGSRRSPIGGRCPPIRARSTTRKSSSTPATIIPQVTWGTSPQDVLPIDGKVPEPGRYRRRRPSASRWSGRWPIWA